jgi:hypothetical protein
VTKEKNGKAKEKKAKREQQPHPFGPPEARAKDYDLPSPNPTLLTYANKSVTNLPKNLREVFEAVGKHAEGVALKSLKVGKMAPKYLHWLVRQLAKHEFLRVVVEKPESKKANASAKKEEK